MDCWSVGLFPWLGTMEKPNPRVESTYKVKSVAYLFLEFNDKQLSLAW